MTACPIWSHSLPIKPLLVHFSSLQLSYFFPAASTVVVIVRPTNAEVQLDVFSFMDLQDTNPFAFEFRSTGLPCISMQKFVCLIEFPKVTL